MKKCPKCGKISDRSFCTDCGTDLRNEPDSNYCLKCGFETDSKFCPNCGAPMGEAAGSKAGGPAEPVKKTEAPSAPAAKAASESKGAESDKKSGSKKGLWIAVAFVAIAAIAGYFFMSGGLGKPKTYDEAVSALYESITENGTQQSDGSYMVSMLIENVSPDIYVHLIAKDGIVTAMYDKPDRNSVPVNTGLSFKMAMNFEPGNEELHGYSMLMHVDMGGGIEGDETAYGIINSTEYNGETPLPITGTEAGLSQYYNVISPEKMVAQDGNDFTNTILNMTEKYLNDNNLGFSTDMLGFPNYTPSPGKID